MDVIKEAFVIYTEEVKDELTYAINCAKNQDWNGLYEVAKDHMHHYTDINYISKSTIAFVWSCSTFLLPYLTPSIPYILSLFWLLVPSLLASVVLSFDPE